MAIKTSCREIRKEIVVDNHTILGRRFIEVCKRVRFIQGMGASWSDRMGTYYYTSHGEFAEDRLFPTKEDLVKNLLKEVKLKFFHINWLQFKLIF